MIAPPQTSTTTGPSPVSPRSASHVPPYTALSAAPHAGSTSTLWSSASLMHASMAAASSTLHVRTSPLPLRSSAIARTCGDGDAAPSDLATESIPGSVRSSPASTDVARESAPIVSAATTGHVSPHPTSARPWRMPASSPPPPTHVTIAAGGVDTPIAAKSLLIS